MFDEQNFPSVEVFILVYNDGDVARKGIQSVLDQTYKNLRVTILENGSSDNTLSTVSEFANDPRVRVIHNESNIRSGLATPYMVESTAEWQSILFSDDYYAPDRIEKMIQAAGDADAVFSNNIYVDQNGRTLSSPPDYVSSVKDISLYSVDEHLGKLFINGNSLHPCAMLIKSDVYKSLGGFPRFMHRLGDMYLFARLLSTYPVKLMPDRLQYITVWTDKRNESAMNMASPVPASLEAVNFVDLYAQEPILSRIDKVFSSHLEPLELRTDAERLWYLGNVTLRYCGIIRREFAFRCFYKAIRLDEPRMDAIILAATGMTAGVYIGKMTEQHTQTITFRQWARQSKRLMLLWVALRKPRLWISSLRNRNRAAPLITGSPASTKTVAEKSKSPTQSA